MDESFLFVKKFDVNVQLTRGKQFRESGIKSEHEENKMSLCYDFQKWTIVSMLSVAISLTIGLVLIQVVHGQDETKQLINNTRQYALCLDIPEHKALDEKLICDSLWGEDGIKVEEIESDKGLIIDDNPSVDRDALISKLKEIKQYCLDHTDRILAGGNPVQRPN